MDDIPEIKAYGSHKDVGYTLVSLSLSRLKSLRKNISADCQPLFWEKKNRRFDNKQNSMTMKRISRLFLKGAVPQAGSSTARVQSSIRRHTAGVLSDTDWSTNLRPIFGELQGTFSANH